MREVRIHLWCDACYSDDDQRREEATDTVTISFGGAPVKTLDLCELHGKSIVEPLTTLLAERGAAPLNTAAAVPKQLALPRTSPAVRQWTCPVCAAEMNRTSALNHVWAVHRPGEERDRVLTSCPECGMKSTRPQAVTTHRMRTHGVDPLALALEGLV